MDLLTMSNYPIEVKTEKLACGVMRVLICGRIDAATSPEFEAAINQLITVKKETVLLFDCEHLEYISSAGLRVFLSTAKLIKAASGKMGLTNLQDNVRQIFEISGFSSVMAIYKTKDEAVKALG